LSKVYIISDLHLGHLSMALKRGFKNVEEHDNHIINTWNSVVLNKKDVVYILGDITMENKRHYDKLDLLRGRKKVVLGNHDRPEFTHDLLNYVDTLSGMIKYKGLILTHCPIHESELKWCHKNIHGHVHEASLANPKYVNVCCEVIGYKPIDIMAFVKVGVFVFSVGDKQVVISSRSLRQAEALFNKNYNLDDYDVNNYVVTELVAAGLPNDMSDFISKNKNTHIHSKYSTLIKKQA